MRRLLAFFVLLATAAPAETIRVATYNASLNRSGPGLLVNDLMSEDEQISKVIQILARVQPDIVLINEFDYDAEGVALDLFLEKLTKAGLDYAHAFNAPVNTGEPSGLDLNGDGEATGPADAWGYGQFPGQYGMVLLSRFPIDTDASRTFQILRWRDLPGAELPVRDDAPFPSETALGVFRLSSKSHWDVAVDTPDGRLRILAAHPTPPVFDGPEDLNGLRNRDEVRLWQLWIEGTELTADQGVSRYDGAPFVIVGDLNTDPEDGDGRREVIAELLAHPRIQDPAPASPGAVEAALRQGGVNPGHIGDPALDTADWNDARGPGNLRVDYALPSIDLEVTGAGVYWPEESDPDHAQVDASDHRLVWVDVRFP